jgi:nucleoside phosphorylase
MNVTLRTPWTVERFLAWEERQELRHEFDGVRTIAMTGGTVAHDAIQT